MKRLILLLFVIIGLSAGAQTSVFVYTTKTLFSGAINDTTIYFQLTRESQPKPYSIQIEVTDTIEGGNLGVYLKGTNGNVYTVISDSLKIDSTSYPQAKFFTGDSFPYWRGGVLINTNGATGGSIKVIINTN